MHPRIRRFTALVGTAALIGGGGLGVAQAQTDTAAQSGKTKAAKRDHGPSDAQIATLADKLGVTTAQLKAAMRATRPSKASRPPKGDRGADLAAALATELGVSTADVKEILDANRPTSRPARGTPPDPSALIAALAEGLGLDEAVVTAAFEKVDAAKQAEHDARDQAMAAALAKELGLSSDAVAAALEATRPPRP